MSSICISKCVEDTNVPTRVRATYMNLYKWPESDADFVRSVSFRGPGHPRPAVVESISCRQLYLKSYTFTRKESVNERTRKCFGKVKDRVVHGKRVKSEGSCGRGGRGEGRTLSETVQATGWGPVKASKDDYMSSSKASISSLENVKTGHSRRRREAAKRVKEVPCATLKAMFRRLLFCCASVDVANDFV